MAITILYGQMYGILCGVSHFCFFIYQQKLVIKT